MPNANLLLLIAALLPPTTLDIFGEVVDERRLATPFGEVGPLALRASKEGAAVWIEPYSGSPTRGDPRAILSAARHLGVQRVLNWDMGVALNPVLSRGQTVIVDDYIDWTQRRPTTFFPKAVPEGESERTAHRPAFCPQLRWALRELMPFASDVVYLGVDGPRRETPAEARMFRTWGVDVLGYHLVPEAALAQEIGLCYAGLVTVAEYDANRAAAIPHGEVRASLGRTLEMLPTFVELASGPILCDCAT